MMTQGAAQREKTGTASAARGAPAGGPRLAAALLAAFVLLAVPASSSAATRHAAADGDNTDTACPQLDPCDIVTAVEGPGVSDGDVVLLAPGVYDAGQTINVNTPDLTVRGGPDVLITASGLPTLQVGAGTAGVEIADMQLTATNSIALDAQDATVRRVVAEKTSVTGSASACRLADGSMQNTLCVGRDAGLLLTASGGPSSSAPSLENVTAIGGSSDEGIVVDAPAGTIVNGTGVNVIALAGDDAVDDVVAGGSGVAGLTLRNSNFDRAQGSVTGPSENDNQATPPQLDADGRQLATSPTVDAGDDSIVSGSERDVDGEHRNQGGGVDIGADEFPVAPEVSFTAPSPPDGHLTNSDASISYAFTSSETDTSFQCALGRPGGILLFFSGCSSPAGFAPDSGTEGTYTVHVRATDSDGDTGTASRTFTYDATAPETVLTQTTAPEIGDPDPAFSFESDEAGASFECRLDSKPWQSCRSPDRPGPLALGQHVYSVRATDRAGNIDPTPASHTFIVADRTAPRLRLSGKGSQSSHKKIVAEASVDEAAKVKIAQKGRMVKISGAGASTSARTRIKLKSATKQLAANASKRLKLKPKGKRSKRKLKKLLVRGKKLTFRLRGTAVDGAGNKARATVKVKVKK